MSKNISPIIIQSQKKKTPSSLIRDGLGHFVNGHKCEESWGFKKGNKLGLGKSYLKGKRVSIQTEFKKGIIPYNKGKKLSLEQRQKMIKNHKGMSGLKHSEESKIKMSLNRMGIKLPFTVRENMSKSKVNFLINNPGEIGRNRAKGGYRIINGRNQYFRSSWEANTARLLDFQKRKWEYEKKTFWFENIKRGTRSYLPDFYLPEEDLYIEVKGYMDAKSKTKLNRMKKYYPNVKIEIWDGPVFKKLREQGMNKLIPGWE